MKTDRFLVLPVLFAALGVQGCLEVKTNTKVNTDGSLERTVVITRDSAEIAKGMRLLGIDSTWTLSWRDSAEQTVGVTATKIVRDAAALSQRDAPEPWVRFSSDVSLETTFRCFTTEYTFREKFYAWNPFDTIP